jgi:hypothetical protein
MEILGDVGHVKSCFGPFGDNFSVGARCTVCAKPSIGSGIILNTLVVLLGGEAQVEARFSLFGDSANLDAR